VADQGAAGDFGDGIDPPLQSIHTDACAYRPHNLGKPNGIPRTRKNNHLPAIMIPIGVTSGDVDGNDNLSVATLRSGTGSYRAHGVGDGPQRQAQERNVFEEELSRQARQRP
jgi:hypothetical protein